MVMEDMVDMMDADMDMVVKSGFQYHLLYSSNKKNTLILRE